MTSAAPYAAVRWRVQGEENRELGRGGRRGGTRSRHGLAHDLGRAYADLVYNGRWFSPTREAIDAFMATIQPRVTGAVRLKLFKGDCRVVGRRSPLALEAPLIAAAPAPETTVH